MAYVHIGSFCSSDANHIPDLDNAHLDRFIKGVKYVNRN